MINILKSDFKTCCMKRAAKKSVHEKPENVTSHARGAIRVAHWSRLFKVRRALFHGFKSIRLYTSLNRCACWTFNIIFTISKEQVLVHKHATIVRFSLTFWWACVHTCGSHCFRLRRSRTGQAVSSSWRHVYAQSLTQLFFSYFCDGHTFCCFIRYSMQIDCKWLHI